MAPEVALRRLGGVATTSDLLRVTSARELRSARAQRRLLRLRRGVWALAEVEHHRRAAVSLAGVVSHLSAAQEWGLQVKEPPAMAWVSVPRKRQPPKPGPYQVAYADLQPHEIIEGRTAPLRTVLDCARRLPFDEALAVADSALRSRLVDADELRLAAASARGNGAGQVRRVAAHASGLAANPFESVLRAITLDHTRFSFVPQESVWTPERTYHPDLVDHDHRVVAEADSFEWHSQREAFFADIDRYTALSAEGWMVLRFTWIQVMYGQPSVLAALDRAWTNRQYSASGPRRERA